MDIKSILRAFRYGELQSRAERDPNQKRPPTIMFLGVAVTLIVVAGAILLMARAGPSPSDGAHVLDVDETPNPTTPTTPSTPTSTGPAVSEQDLVPNSNPPVRH